MGDFYFAYPTAFLLALLAPLFVFHYLRRGFGAAGAVRFSDLSRARRVPPSLSMRLRHSLFVFRLLAFLLLVVALARPQARFAETTLESEGLDIVLCLDLSTSMAAEDLRPGVNRLEVAKSVALDFVRQRKADNIGLVTFAKYATMKCPLTLHHTLLEDFIKRLKTSRLIEEQMGSIRPEDDRYDGTAIGSGLANAVRVLRDSKAKSKVIVLLTDGQNNMGIHPLDAAQAAKALNVRVYTIGVGSRGSAMLPIYSVLGGRRMIPQQVDIDEETLKQIAELTGGKYYRAVDEATLRSIFAEIDKMERTELKDSAYDRYEERFSAFVLAALGFLLLEQLLAHTRFRTLP